MKIGLLTKLKGLSNMIPFRSSNFCNVTYNCKLTVKVFTLKWGNDNERATSSVRYFLEAINPRTYKGGGGGGGGGLVATLPKVFLFFFLDDKSSALEVFYGYSFILRVSFVMVSYYGYEK